MLYMRNSFIKPAIKLWSFGTPRVCGGNSEDWHLREYTPKRDFHKGDQREIPESLALVLANFLPDRSMLCHSLEPAAFCAFQVVCSGFTPSKSTKSGWLHSMAEH